MFWKIRAVLFLQKQEVRLRAKITANGTEVWFQVRDPDHAVSPARDICCIWVHLKLFQALEAFIWCFMRVRWWAKNYFLGFLCANLKSITTTWFTPFWCRPGRLLNTVSIKPLSSMVFEHLKKHWCSMAISWTLLTAFTAIKKSDFYYPFDLTNPYLPNCNCFYY